MEKLFKESKVSVHILAMLLIAAASVICNIQSVIFLGEPKVPKSLLK
jgi:hypothetical protein